jgi:hypothetical protein
MAYTYKGSYTTLCQPDSEKTCFFCCPPLRPYDYDPMRSRSELQTIFHRNRENFLKNKDASTGLSFCPINGWDCWGLGYLDEEGERVGCLLHPSQNNGIDYRYLVGYEGKCAREICLEAITFEALNEKTKKFYLNLTIGMDSFAYSSRKENPIFPILLWGKTVCEKIAENECFQIVYPDQFKKLYSNFIYYLSYKTDGYLIEKIIEKVNISYFKRPDFLHYFRDLKEDLLQRYRINDPSSTGLSRENPSCRPVHLFKIPLSFSRFLKFSLNIWNATEEKVNILKKEIDDKIGRFLSSL